MPSAVILDPTAKTKMRSKIYGLSTFLDPGCPMDFFGAFRDNIREFLQHCSDAERRPTEGMPTWCTLLVDEKSGILIPLYMVEECVRRSRHPFCDYCRCCGWSHHLVSKRRYHLIIPVDNDWDKPLHQDACLLHNHLLHGLLHCNGFGHLLCINGRDGGSKFISGHQVMDLWDRLCTSLQAREVTVVDTSRKNSIDLRLLLGVTYGTHWFGRWGYQFQLGSYGVSEKVYTEALDQLSSLPLDVLIEDSAIAGSSWEISRVVAVYRKLRWFDPCEPFTRLANVRDLLCYLLCLKRRPVASPPPNPPPAPPRPLPIKAATMEKRKRCRDFDAVAAELDSRWPVRRLRVAADVIVDSLLEHGGMTRQEVRDSARLTIGDTGLLDFVLKSIGNSVVGRHVVRRASNPATRVLEFRLEKISSGDEESALEVDREEVESNAETPQLGAATVERELEAVCQALIAARPEATRAVLDCKRWVKKWPLVDDKDDRLRFLCKWEPSSLEKEELKRALPFPEEVVVVEVHASVGDLRVEAEAAMRETYCMMEEFRVTGLDGVAGEEWDPVMIGVANSGLVVSVRGFGADMGCELRYEGGKESWEVECACGAQDDDGERMVACDSCDAWHHTRCIGISEDQPVPPLFLCSHCGSSILGAADSFDAAFDPALVENTFL